MNKTSLPGASKFHNLEPDYTKSVFKLSIKEKNKIISLLTFLYGERKAKKHIKEIERVMGVYYAHKTSDMIEWEKKFIPEKRFSEKDVILITYGDLISDKNQKPLKVLEELSEKYLKNVFNTIHLLPFFPSSSDRGFSIRDFRQVDPEIGTWEDINNLKDNFKLMFDGVFNHVSSKSFWFQEFLNGNPVFENYFTSFKSKKQIPKNKLKMLLRPRTTDVLTPFYTYNGERLVWTTFSADQVDLKFQNPEVLLKIIQIMLIYIRRGADILRLDAVTYLWDELGTTGAHLEQTHAIIKLFRTILDSVAPHVALITETNVPHEDNISYFGNGENEAQMVYNFALPPLILHTFLTGDSTKLSSWASSLKSPSKLATYFNFLDSHDGIGVMGARTILEDNEIDNMATMVKEHGGFVSYKNNSDGTKSIYELNITSYSALNNENSDEPVDLQIKRYIAARSIPLSLVGIPGVYLHGLLGSENDIDAVKNHNDKRSINRKILSKEEIYKKINDPSSTTYKVARKLTSMIQKRISEKAFHPQSKQKVIDAGNEFFCLLRGSEKDKNAIIVVVNVTSMKQRLTLSLKNVIDYKKDNIKFQDILSEKIFTLEEGNISIDAAPYDVYWLKIK